MRVGYPLVAEREHGAVTRHIVWRLGCDILQNLLYKTAVGGLVGVADGDAIVRDDDGEACVCEIDSHLDEVDCVSAGGCGCTCEDETADVGDDFDDDEPPRVGDFQFGLFGFDGVVDDFVDLGFCEFDFHGKIRFCFSGAKIWQKK